MADYKTRLHEDITKLQTSLKQAFKTAAEESVACSLNTVVYRPNGKRSQAIEVLPEEYFAKTGEWPDAVALERLSDMCLYEELTDPDEHKVSRNEYPILSETQIARRQEGKHARKNDNPKIEVPLGIAENYGTDGKRHDYPTRRQRSERENSFVDKEARIRNKERKHKYSEFTKVQPVVVRKLNP